MEGWKVDLIKGIAHRISAPVNILIGTTFSKRSSDWWNPHGIARITPSSIAFMMDSQFVDGHHRVSWVSSFEVTSSTVCADDNSECIARHQTEMNQLIYERVRIVYKQHAAPFRSTRGYRHQIAQSRPHEPWR